MKSLYFQEQQIDVIRINGELWMLASQIGTAIGYQGKPQNHIRKLFNRHRAEFTADMTTSMEIQTNAGMRLSRIFNARGAALLAMLAKTEKAADFRAWVLDVLEGEQNKLPSQRVSLLQKELLSARPEWQKIIDYKEMGLNHVEIGKLLSLHNSTVRKIVRKLELCGLIEPPQNLAHLQQMSLPLLCATPTSVSRKAPSALLLTKEA